MVRDYAASYGVDPAVAVAQIRRESGFNPAAVGRDGERGLAQILASTWAAFSQGIPFDSAFDPDYNLTTWGNYMSWLLARYRYDYTKTLQAYNGGPGNVDRGTVSSGARRYASEILASSAPASGAPAEAPAMSGAAELSPFLLLGLGLLIIWATLD